MDPPPVVGPAWGLTFDEAIPPVLTGFWGADGAVVADPANPSNMVGRAVKSAATAAFYAGTTVSTGPDQSVPDMPFTATNAKVTMRVYSPAAGTRVRMKGSGFENGYEVITLSDCVAATSVEEHENAITYDYPMFSEPMTSAAFIGEL